MNKKWALIFVLTFALAPWSYSADEPVAQSPIQHYFSWQGLRKMVPIGIKLALKHPTEIYYWALIRNEMNSVAESSQFESIPLSQLLLLHTVDAFKDSVDKAEKRAALLSAHADSILAHGALSYNEQQQITPSDEPIRVVAYKENSFVVVGGNGRLVALRKAFGNESPHIEVQVYYPNKPDSMTLWIEKIRKIQKLLRTSACGELFI